MFICRSSLNLWTRYFKTKCLEYGHPYCATGTRTPYLYPYSIAGGVRVRQLYCVLTVLCHILWYTCVGRVIYINGHLESLGPTLKLFFKFTSFRCFLMCILYWPSCGCYLIETVSSQCCPCWFISIYSTGINLCNISVLLSCIYAAHTGCSTDSECRCPYCRHSHF